MVASCLLLAPGAALASSPGPGYVLAQQENGVVEDDAAVGVSSGASAEADAPAKEDVQKDAPAPEAAEPDGRFSAADLDGCIQQLGAWKALFDNAAVEVARGEGDGTNRVESLDAESPASADRPLLCGAFALGCGGASAALLASACIRTKEQSRSSTNCRLR